MQNLLTLLLVCCCFSPAFAQGGCWGRALAKGTKGVVNASAVERGALRATSSFSQHIQITNLPGEPLVKLGGAVENTSAVLPARMLTGAEYRRITNADNDDWSTPLYLPLALNTAQRAFYRGLSLNNLDAVKNILNNGLRVREVSRETENKIYFSGYARRAMQFSVRASGDEENLLPTMVQFNVPTYADVHVHKLLGGLKDYIVHNDIRSIMDVMVFLEVDGKADWYKATLEDGKLVFTPVPSRMFTYYSWKY